MYHTSCFFVLSVIIYISDYGTLLKHIYICSTRTVEEVKLIFSELVIFIIYLQTYKNIYKTYILHSGSLNL